MTELAGLDVVVGGDISGAMGGLDTLDNRIDGFAKSAGRRLGMVGGAITAGVTLPLMAAGREASGMSIELESAFAGVIKTVDGTSEELAALRGDLLALATGVTDSPVAALEGAPLVIMEVAEAAGQLGVAQEDIVDFSETMAALGMATDITGAAGAQMLAQFGNQAGIDGEGYRLLGDVIATLGNNAATTESQILTFGSRMGTLAGMNFEADQILAYGSAMASAGISAELGSTNFVQGVTEMQIAAAQGGPALDSLAATAGMTADEFQALAESDPSAAMREFVAGLGELDTADQVAALEALGLTGSEAQRVFRTLAQNVGLLDEQLALADEAFEGNGALMDEAGRRAETTAGKINILRNNLFVAASQGGDVLNESLNELLDIAIPLSQRLTMMDPDMVRMAVSFGVAAAAIGPLIAGLGAIAFAIGVVGAPVAVAIAAITLLGSAWAFNVYGIRDATISVFETVQDVFAELQDLFGFDFETGGFGGLENVLSGLELPSLNLNLADKVNIQPGDLAGRIRARLREVLQSGLTFSGGLAAVAVDIGQGITPNMGDLGSRVQTAVRVVLQSGLAFGGGLTAVSVDVGSSITPNMGNLASRVNISTADAINIGLGLAALTFGGPVAAVGAVVKMVGWAINSNFLGLATTMEAMGLPTTISGAVASIKTMLATAASGLSFGDVSFNTASLSFDSLVTGINTKLAAIDWNTAVQGSLDFAGGLMSSLATNISNISQEDVNAAITVGLDVIKAGFVMGMNLMWTTMTLGINFGSWLMTNIIVPIGSAFATADYTQFQAGAQALMTALWAKLAGAVPAVGEWVNTNLWTPMVTELGALNAETMGAAVGGFGTNLVAALASTLPDFGTWVQTTIITPIMDGLKALPGLMAQAINNAIPNDVGFDLTIPNPVPGVSRPLFEGRISADLPDNPIPVPSLDVGGKILSDGLAMVHAGERVLTPAETEQYDAGRRRGGRAAAAGGGGNTFNIVSYGQSAGDVYDMLAREARNRSGR
jgi:TP901 family phage tail tape measure protein